MPTPSADTAVLSPPAEPISHPTRCPPEDVRPLPSTEPADRCDAADVDSTRPYFRHMQQPTPPADGSEASETSSLMSSELKTPTTATEDEDLARDTPSPSCAAEEPESYEQKPSRSLSGPSDAPAGPFCGPLGSPFSKTRFLPNSTSSYLQPGSKFKGTQQSDRQVYDVQVELKHVDMAESFLCGYLRIQGLTDDHPTLTTYFEGEIIGTKYTFQTRHPEWGSNEKVDMQHWGRFPAWRPLAKQARRPDFSYKNFAQRENIFMRWKEYFLVPDHRVRTISGASFEGFYYICFNQVSGTVSGIYFHSKSEKYQQLELKHVEDHGCISAFEFR